MQAPATDTTTDLPAGAQPVEESASAGTGPTGAEEGQHMDIASWIVTVLLALAFLVAGATKLLRPKPLLARSGLAWVEDFSAGAVKGIGAVEVVGALGLVLPKATGIAPVLSPIAAIGLAITMALATRVHVRRRETPAPAIGLGVLAVITAVLGFATL